MRISADALVDRTATLNRTARKIMALINRLRALNANSGNSAHGILTDSPGELTNDFFVNLLDMSTQWVKSSEEGVYEGRVRSSGAKRWTATPVDLVFGSHAELRAVAEVHGASDGDERFVDDFIAAWVKVMNLDRF